MAFSLKKREVHKYIRSWVLANQLLHSPAMWNYIRELKFPLIDYLRTFKPTYPVVYCPAVETPYICKAICYSLAASVISPITPLCIVMYYVTFQVSTLELSTTFTGSGPGF